MATKRPTFGRVDTDIPLSDLDSKSPGHLKDESSRDASKRDYLDEDKSAGAHVTEVDGLPTYDAEAEDHFGEGIVVTNAKDLVTHVLHVDDDPSLNPWTFRAFFLGACLWHYGYTPPLHHDSVDG